MFRCVIGNHSKPSSSPHTTLEAIVSTFVPTVLTPLILDYAKVVQQTICVFRVPSFYTNLTHPDFDYNINGWYDGFIKPTNYTGNDTHFYIVDAWHIRSMPASKVSQFTLTHVNTGSKKLSGYLYPREFVQVGNGQALTMFRDEVYLIGGTRCLGEYPYNTRKVVKLTQSMTPVSIPRLCRHRTFAAAVTVNNRIYCIGGTAESRKTGRSMEVYDGVKWHLVKSTMYFSHQHHTAVAYEHYIIVTGGYIVLNDEWVKSKRTEVYDLTTDRWELKTSSIPNQGGRHKLFLFNSQVMLTDWSTRWWTYNLVEDTWNEYEPSEEIRYPWPIIP